MGTRFWVHTLTGSSETVHKQAGPIFLSLSLDAGGNDSDQHIVQVIQNEASHIIFI